MTILENFYQSVNSLGPYEVNGRIAVALSGGSDSLALTLLLNNWCLDNGCELHAITIDHGIREEAAQEAQLMHKMMTNHKIKHVVLNLEENTIDGKNLQENARNARYQKLLGYCNKNQILHLFTGHTLDDQIENFFIRLTRGTTLRGLSGIKSKILRQNTRILRPLLNFARENLQTFLEEQKISWLADPSNENQKFTRVKARKFINSEGFLELSNQPDKQVLFSRIRKIIAEISDDDARNENDILEFLIEHCKIMPAGFAILSLDKPSQIKKKLLVRVLAKIITTISGTLSHQPRFSSLENLYHKIFYGDFKTSTIGNCIINYNKNNNTLIIAPENHSPKERFVITGKDAFTVTEVSLSKKNAPELPVNIRHALLQIDSDKTKKTIPFHDQDYYNNVLIEFSPLVALVENTNND